MPLQRAGFEIGYTEIVPGSPEMGRAAVLPWDTELFGFPVGAYQPASPEISDGDAEEFPAAFHAWAGHCGLLLTVATISPSSASWKRLLPQSGFLFVDSVLQAVIPNLKKWKAPEVRSVLRPATATDKAAVQEIAAKSFHHGRYHADPMFPRHLADLRYRRWMENAWANAGGIDRIYVLEDDGVVAGIYHVTVKHERADLRLAALAPELKGTLFGFDLYSSMLRTLQELGVKRVETSISASNVAVLNIYATLGFHFAEPELVYHWHARDFPTPVHV